MDAVGGLSQRSLETLRPLSVLSGAFDLELAVDLAGVSRTDVVASLEEAARAGLAQLEAGQGRFEPAARDALYQDLGIAGQALAHERAADVLRRLRPGDLAARAAQLMGAISLVGLEPVLAALTAAADTALRAYEWEEAAEHLGRAVELTRARRDHRANELDLRRAYALYRAGLYADAMASCRAVALSARQSGDFGLLARSAMVVRGIDDRAICGELLETLRAAIGSLAPDSPLAARARANMVLLEAQLHRRPADEAQARESLEVAVRGGDPRAIVEALHAVESSLQGPRRALERLQVADRMQQLAERADLDEYMRWPLSWRVDGLWLLGRRPALDEAIDRLEGYARARRDGLGKWKAVLARASLAAVEGRFADAAALADAALAAAHAGGHESAVFIDRLLRTHLASVAHGDQAGDFRIRDFPRGGEVYAIYSGMEAAARGELEEARVLFERSWPLIDAVVDHELELSFYRAFAVTIMALELPEPARALHARLAPFADMMTVGASGAVVSAGSVSQYMGELAALAGDWKAMDEDFTRALRRNIEFGDRPSTARTRYSWASGLLRRGLARDRDRAESLLDAASRDAAELGMAPLSEAIAALQRDLRSRPEHTLTPRELEVARLVATGLTNKEIARVLKVSVRTAETHLLNVMTKLGLENRAQVAAWVARHPLTLR